MIQGILRRIAARTLVLKSLCNIISVTCLNGIIILHSQKREILTAYRYLCIVNLTRVFYACSLRMHNRKYFVQMTLLVAMGKTTSS